MSATLSLASPRYRADRRPTSALSAKVGTGFTSEITVKNTLWGSLAAEPVADLSDKASLLKPIGMGRHRKGSRA